MANILSLEKQVMAIHALAEGNSIRSKGYAWAYDKAKGSEMVAVLELPPVISPKTAVQASIVGKMREQARN
jgi:hypothetical protein